MERSLPTSPSPRQHAVNAVLHGTPEVVDRAGLDKEVQKEVVVGERTPLLHRDQGDQEQVSLKSGRRHSWRSLVLVMFLWVASLCISASYSMIGPFFPREVSQI